MPATVGGAINGQPTYEAAGEALRRRGSPKSRQPRESRQPQSAALIVASSRPAAPTSTPPRRLAVTDVTGPQRQRVTHRAALATSLPNGYRFKYPAESTTCRQRALQLSRPALLVQTRGGGGAEPASDSVQKLIILKPGWLVKGVRSEAIPFPGSMLKEWTCPKTNSARPGTPWHAQPHPRRRRCDDATR